MTLDTKLAIAIQNQIVTVFRPHGVMAGNACDHPAGSRIRHFFAHRMGKLALIFMALRADLQAVPFEQGHIISAMGVMAIRAVVDVAMLILTGPVLVHGSAMAGGTHLFLPGPQQPLLVPCMRRMTIHAAVAIAAAQMTMGGLHLFQDLGMALPALIHADAA